MYQSPGDCRRGYLIVADTHFATRMARPVGPDLCVRVMEYIRQHFHEFDARLPTTCEFDLIAGGHPHNVGPVLMLGMHVPPGTTLPAELSDFITLYGVFEHWCEGVSDANLREFGRTTDAPTWDELVRLGTYPSR